MYAGFRYLLQCNIMYLYVNVNANLYIYVRERSMRVIKLIIIFKVNLKCR